MTKVGLEAQRSRLKPIWEWPVSCTHVVRRMRLVKVMLSVVGGLSPLLLNLEKTQMSHIRFLNLSAVALSSVLTLSISAFASQATNATELTPEVADKQWVVDLDRNLISIHCVDDSNPAQLKRAFITMKEQIGAELPDDWKNNYIMSLVGDQSQLYYIRKAQYFQHMDSAQFVQGRREPKIVVYADKCSLRQISAPADHILKHSNRASYSNLETCGNAPSSGSGRKSAEGNDVKFMFDSDGVTTIERTFERFASATDWTRDRETGWYYKDLPARRYPGIKCAVRTFYGEK